MAINLIVSTALWAVWRRDRSQAFTYYLSLAGFVALVGPLAYLAWRQPAVGWSMLGALALVAYDSGYFTLLTYGVSHLASRPLRHSTLVILATIVALIDIVLLAFDSRTAQAVSGILSTGVGVIAMIWLWPLAWPERLTGVLLVLLGLNQFTYVALGDAGVAAQAGVAGMLRVCLGFALVHAAVRRSSGEAERMRRNFAAMAQHSHQGVAVVRGESVLYANAALLRIYGLEQLSDFGPRFRDLSIPEEERAAVRERHRRLMSGAIAREDWEGTRFRSDGSLIRLRFSGWRIDWDGTPAEQVIVSDDTEIHEATQALLYRATHDELSGLPNRSALLQRLRELCGRTDAAPFALLLLDVDRFKLFNDAHSYALGDEVLKALARALSQGLAGRNEVMHLGEDEFAVVAPWAKTDPQVEELIDEVRRVVSAPLRLAQHNFFIDVSMGVAAFPTHAREPERLLRAADAAMHDAKHTPGTSVTRAAARFEQGSSEALAQEQALRAGIRDGEFHLVYEPKIHADSAMLIGFEALARWNRPGMGTISPLHFIATAERTGLISALGTTILTETCRQIAEWRRALGGSVPIAVNVSPMQLLDPDFPDIVAHTLRRFDVPAHLLSLEITETAAVAHLEQACEQLRRIRALGVDVALDDFGAGFSSLSMLRSLPVQAVKIDRSLIDPMPADDAVAVVRAICALASALSLAVVAEGVESEDHALAARDAGCDALQGYLFSHPLAPAAAAHWIRRSRSGVSAAHAGLGGR
jgi:diguanylate cyclase (GGDEF)-like protein/PAS domain S-box-containing protein